MNTTALLDKLIEVEWALQNKNYTAARALVMQAEESVLQMDRDIIHAQTEKVRRAAYSPSRTKVLSPTIAAAQTCSGNRRWRSIPKAFSRILLTVRTSVQRLPSPLYRVS